MTDDQPIPVAPQSKSDANNDAAHPRSNATAEVKIPPSHASYTVTCNKKRDKWDIAKLVAEFIGLGFLIAYTLYTAGIYRANKKAAEAAKSAADTAHDTLVKGNRPWLGIDGFPQIKEPVKISAENGKERADFVVLLTVKNFGTAPALHMKVDMRNFDNKTANLAEWATLQKAFIDNSCTFAESRMHPTKSIAIDDRGHQIAVPESDYGPYIFPGTPGLANEWHMGLPSLDERTGELRLLGCIAYADQFRTVHHSTFCFRGNDSVTKASPRTRFAICDMNQYAD